MRNSSSLDSWSAGEAYEHYMGRWSLQIAARFIDWLNPKPHADWLEIGCGTGALTRTILAKSNPKSIHAIDPSQGFVDDAAARISDPRVRIETGKLPGLSAPNGSYDCVTSALVLNFVPDLPAGLADMRRVLRKAGQLSFYVWDYPGGGMGFISAFWKAAKALDPAAAELDESTRFPACSPKGLAKICAENGLAGAEIAPIETITRFDDFEAFWRPFTMGAGPAPGYCASLSDSARAALKAQLAADLGASGPVELPARAWAVKCQIA